MDVRQIEMRIARSENLPVMPALVTKVLNITNRENPSITELEAIMATDTAISAKVLKVANSPLYTMGACSSLGTAISMLGFRVIKSLIISIAYQQLIGPKGASELFSKKDFWLHSLATGVAAKHIVRKLSPADADDVYIAGMLHDVGMLVLSVYAPEEFDNIIKKSHEQAIPILDAAQELYGIDHAELGDMLAKKWNLPEMLQHAIKYHHRPLEDNIHQRTTAIVAVANIIAHQSGFTNNTVGVTYEMDKNLLNIISLQEADVAPIAEKIVEEVMNAESSYV